MKAAARPDMVRILRARENMEISRMRLRNKKNYKLVGRMEREVDRLESFG